MQLVLQTIELNTLTLTRKAPHQVLYYGGKAGATLTVGAGVSFSAPESGAGLSLNHSVSHNVPPYTYGYIRLKASYTVNVRKLEVRYLGTNKWVPAGQTSTISNVSVWSELVTWK